jgi:metallopeptidase MepB
MVSKTRYSRFHGSVGVNVDFGELPSQMLELWCWEPLVLKSISCHYSYLPNMLEGWSQINPKKTQPEKHMPDALIEAFLEARYLSFGPLFYLEQLQRAIFDMTVHQPSSVEEAKSFDLPTIWNKLGKDLQSIDGPEVLGQDYSWGHGYCSSSHIMAEDYSAGYYSYL